MAGKNVTIAGASYTAVPAVDIPVTGGGTARFTEVSDTTAVASDVAQGKYFYTAGGVRTAGTASGGSYPDGDNEGWGTPSQNYSVTITLTNPSNPTKFNYGEALSANGANLGDEIETLFRFTSPTGSGTFAVDPSVPYLWVDLSGSEPNPQRATVTTTGGITYDSLTMTNIFVFSISGSGTITIDGMEYYDE